MDHASPMPCRSNAPRIASVAIVLTSWIVGAPGAGRAQRAPWRLDASRPITYFIQRGSPDSGYQAGDAALARWALEAWAAQADPPLDLAAGPEGSATVRVYWMTPMEGEYGEMRGRQVEGRLAADVFVSPDTDLLGVDVAEAARLDPLFRDTIVYLTCVHELGHALGLAHTAEFADIMYTFQFGGDLVAYFMRFREQIEARDDIPRASPFSPADRAALRALYPAGKEQEPSPVEARPPARPALPDAPAAGTRGAPPASS